MLVNNGNGTYTVGPLDVICIYHNVTAGTYHPVIYRESPMPGVIKPHTEADNVRLKSSMHHTEGAPTFDGALGLLAQLRERILIPDCNVFTEQALPWDGQLADVMVVSNWRKPGFERDFRPDR